MWFVGMNVCVIVIFGVFALRALVLGRLSDGLMHFVGFLGWMYLLFLALEEIKNAT